MCCKLTKMNWTVLVNVWAIIVNINLSHLTLEEYSFSLQLVFIIQGPRPSLFPKSTQKEGSIFPLLDPPAKYIKLSILIISWNIGKDDLDFTFHISEKHLPYISADTRASRKFTGQRVKFVLDGVCTGCLTNWENFRIRGSVHIYYDAKRCSKQ